MYLEESDSETGTETNCQNEPTTLVNHNHKLIFSLTLAPLLMFASYLLITYEHPMYNQFLKKNLSDPKTISKLKISKKNFNSQVNFRQLSDKFINFTVYDEIFNSGVVGDENCERFKMIRGYQMEPVSDVEAVYPIAYSIVIHKQFQMFERLLKAIYRPQNIYCIHVDQKAGNVFKTAVKNLISCFDNVFQPEKQVEVYYRHYSRVEADLVCLKELERYNYKYVLNLCGQDFPLVTNLVGFFGGISF